MQKLEKSNSVGNKSYKQNGLKPAGQHEKWRGEDGETEKISPAYLAGEIPILYSTAEFPQGENRDKA